MSQPTSNSTAAKTAIMTITAMKIIQQNAWPLGNWMQREHEWEEEHVGDDIEPDEMLTKWEELKNNIDGHCLRSDLFKIYTAGDKKVDYQFANEHVVTPNLNELRSKVSTFFDAAKPIGFLMNYKSMDSLCPSYQFIKDCLETAYDIECKPVCIRFFADPDYTECETKVYAIDDESIDGIVTIAEKGKKRPGLTGKDEKIQFLGEENSCFQWYEDEDDGYIGYMGYAMICRPTAANKEEKEEQDKKKQKQ